jgi:hypothetical protein
MFNIISYLMNIIWELYCGSRDVVRVYRCFLNNLGTVILFPTWKTNYFVVQNALTGSGVNSASSSIGVGGFSPGIGA